MFFFALFFYYVTSTHVCLGAGIDVTTMQSNCLAKIYDPTDETTFETDIPESQLIEFSVVMQSSFDINAYFNQKTESNGFLGLGYSSKEIYRFYQNYYLSAYIIVIVLDLEIIIFHRHIHLENPSTFSAREKSC